MQPTEWINILEYGFGAAALTWIGWFVVIPLRDRHVKFLDSVEKTNESLSNTVQKQATILEGLLSTQNQMAKNQEKLGLEMEKLSEIVEKLANITQHLRSK